MMETEELELTEIEQKVFDVVKERYAERNTIMINEDAVKKFIKLGNTHGDGKKRVYRIGEKKPFLVPMEDFFTETIEEQELDKYPMGN